MAWNVLTNVDYVVPTHIDYDPTTEDFIFDYQGGYNAVLNPKGYEGRASQFKCSNFKLIFVEVEIFITAVRKEYRTFAFLEGRYSGSNTQTYYIEKDGLIYSSFQVTYTTGVTGIYKLNLYGQDVDLGTYRWTDGGNIVALLSVPQISMRITQSGVTFTYDMIWLDPNDQLYHEIEHYSYNGKTVNPYEYVQISSDITSLLAIIKGEPLKTNVTIYNRQSPSSGQETSEVNAGSLITIQPYGTIPEHYSRVTIEDKQITGQYLNVGQQYKTRPNYTDIEYYWHGEKYDISFNRNGGNYGTNEDSSTYATRSVQYPYTTNLPRPIKTHYDGKWRDSNGTLYNFGASFRPTKTETLEAVWTDHNYRITYNNPYGSSGTTYAYGIFNSTITLKSPGTRQHYTFDGWYMGNTRVGGAGDTYTIKGDVTLEARWVGNRYTVTFDTDGGNYIAPMSVNYPDKITLPTTSKGDYYVMGWYDGNTKIGDIGEEYQPLSNITIKAKYSAYYLLREYMDGILYRQTKTIPSETVTLTNYVKDRNTYTPIGWFDSSDNFLGITNVTITIPSAIISEPQFIHYNRKFKKNPLIKYNENGCPITFQNERLIFSQYTDNDTNIRYIVQEKQLPTISKTIENDQYPMYSLAGWKYNGRIMSIGDAIFLPTNNVPTEVTFVAEWEKILPDTITFEEPYSTIVRVGQTIQNRVKCEITDPNNQYYGLQPFDEFTVQIDTYSYIIVGAGKDKRILITGILENPTGTFTQLTLKAYDNSATTTYSIRVILANAITFNVDGGVFDPSDTGYETESSTDNEHTYITNETGYLTNYPSTPTKTVNGVQYQFKGWYDQDGNVATPTRYYRYSVTFFAKWIIPYDDFNKDNVIIQIPNKDGTAIMTQFFLGTITTFEEMPNLSTTSMPTPMATYENAFVLDKSITTKYSVKFSRKSPDYPDDSSNDSRDWTNRKYLEVLLSVINRWQGETDGCKILYLPHECKFYELDGKTEGWGVNYNLLGTVNSEEIGFLYKGKYLLGYNAYISNLDIVYDAGNPDTITGTIKYALGGLKVNYVKW